jgi:[ribosomal protein S18]-alanine N-acetyltransferase
MHDVEIKKLSHETNEAEWCARVMSESEPWVTLGRGYEGSLQTITDSSKEVFLAVVQEKHAGFIILNMKGAFFGYIQTVCISPDFRGRGIGSKLIEFAESRIFKESPNVFLCVSSFNTEAKKLYERLGYETIGEMRDYIVKGYAEILMRKTIGPLSEFVWR